MSRQPRHIKAKHFALTACVVVAAAAFLAVAPPWTNANEPATITTELMPAEKMNHASLPALPDSVGMSMTGDVDIDFAANMRKHRRRAIEMSRVELESGTNPEMRLLASTIVIAHEKEIAAFDRWLIAQGHAGVETIASSQ